MSEAILEELQSSSNRYFCHSCSKEIDRNRITPDFQCPDCQSGFIEELPDSAPENQSDNEAQFFRVQNDMFNPSDSPYLRITSEILSPLFMATSSRLAGNGSNSRSNILDDATTEASSTGNSQDAAADGQGSSSGRRRSNRRYGQMNFENFLQEILISISDGANVGGTPMFFMGNPGDYAWGREGLDTIVTQLLNQMDNSGPPPLDKEKIKEIPMVEITSDQVDIKLQCSVCWEDFKLGESVRKLSCSHVYHEGCIIPWLELHGTCPICRQSLAPECEMPETDQARVNSWSQQVVNQLRNTLGGGGDHHASTSTSTSQPTQSQQLQQQLQQQQQNPDQNSSHGDDTMNFSISIDTTSSDNERSEHNNSSNNSNSRMRDGFDYEYD